MMRCWLHVADLCVFYAPLVMRVCRAGHDDCREDSVMVYSVCMCLCMYLCLCVMTDGGYRMEEMIEMTRTTSEGPGRCRERTSDDLDPGRTFDIKHRKVIESREMDGWKPSH